MSSKRQQTGKGRKVLGSVLIAVCAAFVAYFMAVLIYRLATVSVEKYWSFVRRFFAEFGIMCLLSLPAFDVRFGIFSWTQNKLSKIFGIILRVLSCIICAIFLALGVTVVATGAKTGDRPVDNVCVLGLAIDKKDVLPHDLELRLDRALEYKADHPDLLFIVTGGNSEDPYYSEAAYMSRYLEAHGFDASVGGLIVESNAKTTVENFKYTSTHIDKEKTLGVITNDLHIFRSTAIAKKQGFTSIVRIPAPSEPFQYCENVMWEMICSFFQILKGEMAL